MLNPLAATATDVAELLQTGKATSKDIVRIYLDQIEQHNTQGLNLRAVISVSAKHALSQAATLDAERRDGKIRGPLHGVPILIKDSIQTSAELGVPTTAGAAVFRHATARQDATIVRRLRQQGLIILGKASLTEFCGNKATNMTCGWNAVFGQTQSAWVEGGRREDDSWYGRSTPGGSSSGSAVGVAAGFAPLAIGTETTGSLVMPANRAGLYALKLSHEEELLEGALPLCMAFDAVGGMARSAEDLEALIRAMTGDRDIKVEKRQWEDMRLGFINPNLYGIPADEGKDSDDSHRQIMREYETAIDRIRGLGAKVVYPVDLITLDQLQYKGKNAFQSASHRDIQDYWPEWIARMDHSPVQTFAELVEWNKANPDVAMPAPHTDQTDLLEAAATTLTRQDIDQLVSTLVPRAAQSIEDCLSKHGIDLIIGPGDNLMCAIASIGQCPNGMVPLGILDGPKGMGQPQGLMVMTGRHDEGRILEFMKLWNQVHGPWQIAKRLQTLK